MTIWQLNKSNNTPCSGYLAYLGSDEPGSHYGRWDDVLELLDTPLEGPAMVI